MQKIARTYEPKFILYANCFTAIIILTVWYFGENDITFSNSHQDLEQGKLLAALNFRK